MKNIAKYSLILLFLSIYYVYKLSVFSVNDNTVTFLNVGNGDSILIKSGGKYLLIDGGTSSYSLNNLYKYTNYHVPTSYIISHPHMDHVSGLIPILNYNSTFYDIYVPENYISSKALSRYFYNLSTENLKPLIKGDVVYIGDFKLSVLWPNANCDNNDLNYCSLVMLLSFKDVPKVLLMSDVPKNVQEQFTHQVGEVEILKVPHQGAEGGLNKNLSRFLHPRYAVFSVGKNSYGHPHSTVLDFYKNLDAEIRRTDKFGDITFYFK